MTVTKTKEGTTLNMTIAGSLDTISAPDFEKELKESIDGVETLNLDFKDLEYISSSGLRVLLYAYKTVGSHGEVIVYNVNETIHEIFELTGFSDFVKCR